MIDPKIADRIFGSLFTTKPHGMGMGLSICQSIIDAHGGHIRASPRVPHGTAFRFTVPTAPRVSRRPIEFSDGMVARAAVTVLSDVSLLSQL